MIVQRLFCINTRYRTCKKCFLDGNKRRNQDMSDDCSKKWSTAAPLSIRIMRDPSIFEVHMGHVSSMLKYLNKKRAHCEIWHRTVNSPCKFRINRRKITCWTKAHIFPNNMCSLEFSEDILEYSSMQFLSP